MPYSGDIKKNRTSFLLLVQSPYALSSLYLKRCAQCHYCGVDEECRRRIEAFKYPYHLICWIWTVESEPTRCLGLPIFFLTSLVSRVISAFSEDACCLVTSLQASKFIHLHSSSNLFLSSPTYPGHIFSISLPCVWGYSTPINFWTGYRPDVEWAKNCVSRAEFQPSTLGSSGRSQLIPESKFTRPEASGSCRHRLASLHYPRFE